MIAGFMLFMLFGLPITVGMGILTYIEKKDEERK